MNSTLTTFNQLNLLYQEQKKQWAQRLNIKLAQVNILMLVAPEQALLSHAALIDSTKLDASTLSRQLNGMAQEGLLVKTKGTEPRQRVYTLTEHAQRIATRLRQWQTELEQQVQDNWSAEEQQLLKILLNRYYQSFIRFEK
ncbi:MarR family winged helix-turn-helix transcriptional regulator [Latilactobacillus fuchuensis]|uniref:MarR family protein n=2 Tax=Latilactobacillus fuchuensis TaxID=164393 RepID=A0A2N9DV94_9LACO|nr:MarR family winged helix-turn-helix transcriptional regulator [Latilactobacillus fuchuensis]KRL62058.1 marR family protein [Latilactobacillus fuchuensis DSM 14340 = JCM 11249]MCP8856850.1 MarR family winged helix-turn-helix transcriptional regulator [Latilactobacillus fuchuensis]SPC38356.1 MarR family protein [Latilactobacillus fuchuensis]